MSKLSENIKYFRKALGYTQDTLAQTLRDRYSLKIIRPTITRWETDEQTPSLYYTKCLAEIFNVSLDELCGEITPKVIAADTASPTGDIIVLHKDEKDEKTKLKNKLSKRILNSDLSEEELKKISKMIDLLIN